LLFVFFLLCGFSRIAQETFKYESVIDQKPTFLLAAFTIAGIPSLILLIYRFRPILKMEFAIGIGLHPRLHRFSAQQRRRDCLYDCCGHFNAQRKTR